MRDIPEQPQLLVSMDDGRPILCCGLDEVGRGALAGPLVAAGVVLPDDFAERLGPLARFLRDSKTVPRVRRVELAEQIRMHALVVEVVAIPVEMINRRGIGWANREAFRRLIAAIEADDYVVDGKVRPFAPRERQARVRCLVKADALVPAVSAASLVAKVYRDALMAALHNDFPAYCWRDNVGYGTPAHLAALRTHGSTPHHRTVFIKTALNGGQKARRGKQDGAEMLELLFVPDSAEEERAVKTAPEGEPPQRPPARTWDRADDER